MWIFRLLLAVVCCHSALIGRYKLYDSIGSDLYDFSGSGNHAVISSNGGSSYVVTDRGYYISNTCTIDLLKNKYKSNSGSSEIILGFWLRPTQGGTMTTFNTKSNSSSPVVKLNWNISGYDANLQLLKDGVSIQNVPIIQNYACKRHLDIWRFHVFYLKEVSGNTEIKYYRRPDYSPGFQYTLSSVSISNTAISFSVGSKSEGVKGFVYEIFWHDSLEVSIANMHSSFFSEAGFSNLTCLFKPSGLDSCIAYEADPYKTSGGVDCDATCKNSSKSCKVTSSDCIDSTCDSECITGCYNLNSLTCICPSRCNVCNIGSGGVMICSQCASGYVILPGSREYSCVLNCPSEYYKDESSSPLMCKKCGDYCDVCTNETVCNKCQTNYYLKDGACVSSCGVGYFHNETTKSCESCSINCESCSYSNSELICNDCNINTYLKDGACVASCGVGYFQSETTKKCESCSSNCESCSYSNSALVCNKCMINYYLRDRACVTSCGVGYFQNETTKACEHCSTNCKSCSYSNSDLICNDCNINTYLKNGVCVTSCGVGYFQNEITKACENCSTNCVSCSYLNSELLCNSCHSNTYLKEVTCVASCGVGYFQNEITKTCEICSTGCEHCSYSDSDLICNDCNINTYLKDGLCVNSCGIGYFQNETSKTCEICSRGCEQCFYSDSDLKCTNCNSDTYLKNGLCESSCGSGYYIIDQVCYVCSIIDCLECQSLEICTSCKVGKSLIDQEGSMICDVCGDGSYLSDYTCLECPEYCSKCTENICEECVNNYSLEGNQCIMNEKLDSSGSDSGSEIGGSTDSNPGSDIGGSTDSDSGSEIGGSTDSDSGSDTGEATISPKVYDIGNKKIELVFNIPLTFTLEESHVSISAKEEPLTQDSYLMSESQTAQVYIIAMQTSESVITLKLNQAFHQKISGFILTQDTFNLILSSSSTVPSSNDSVKSQSEYLAQNPTAVEINSITGTAIQVSVITAVGMGFFSPSCLWSFLNSIQILSYMPMLNIEFPLFLFATLSGAGDYNPLPSIIEYIIPIEDHTPLYRAVLLGYDTSQFIINIGSILSTLSIFLISYPLLQTIKKILNKDRPEGCLYKLVSRSISNYRWNVFTRFFLQSYLDIALAAFLQSIEIQEYTENPNWNKMVNLVFGLISCVFLLFFPIALGQFIYRNHGKTGQEDFSARWASIFEEFKEGHNYYLKFYYVHYLVARFLLVVCFCILEENPIAQVILASLACWSV